MQAMAILDALVFKKFKREQVSENFDFILQ